MEGLNVPGILLGYLTLLVLAITAVGAIGLAFARPSYRAKRFLAVGLFAAAGCAALAFLTNLGKGYDDRSHDLLCMLSALALVMAGGGQFVSALRSRRRYVASLSCAIASVVLLAIAHLGGSDVMEGLVRGINRHLQSLRVPIVVASLVLALASVFLALGRKHRGSGSS